MKSPMRWDALAIQEMVDPSKKPTPEQERVIQAPRRPLLVVAGAGSGKTETMSMRVLWLLANNEDITPSSVLGLTFTRKAAGELGDRLRARIRLLGTAIPDIRERLDEDPVSLTYNSFAERIVSEHGMRIGVDPDFALLGEASALDMMTSIVEGWSSDLDDEYSIATVAQGAFQLAGQIREHGYGVEEARVALEDFGTLLAHVGNTNPEARKLQKANQRRLRYLGPIAEYQRRKQEAGLLDFSDQLVLANRIVQEAPSVRDAIRGEFRAVLLDEFQDTSVIQMDLLSGLFRDHAITAVGDPNQAIYGWRGASASSLETFLDRFHEGEAAPEQTLTLSTAWRNDRAILDAANRVASPLRIVPSYQAGAKTQLNAQSPILTPRPGAGEGRVDIDYTHTYRQSLDAVVRFVNDVRSKGNAQGKRPSLAVLCRRRSDFPYVDVALREAGIPTQIVGLGGLLHQPGVQDVRAALELANDVSASVHLARLLSGIDLGAADLVALGDWARQLARTESRDAHQALLLDAVDNPPEPGWRAHSQGETEGGEQRPAISEEAVRRVRLLGQRLRDVRAGLGRGITEQVERAIRIMGTLDDVIADPLSVGGRAALDEFISVAAAYEREVPGASLSSFLTYLQMAEEKEDGLEAPISEPDPLAVQIMTIHASKGLEWDGVVVFSLDDGIFPSHSSKKSVSWRDDPPGNTGWVYSASDLPYPLRGDRADLPDFALDVSDEAKPSAAFKKWMDTHKLELGEHSEREERRLAYVALTRARSAQLLVGSWRHISGSSQKVRHPSRYLMESGAELFGEEKLTAYLSPRDETGELVEHDYVAVRSNVGECLVMPAPSEDLMDEAMGEEKGTFPEAAGPSRRAMAGAAAAVMQHIRTLNTSADVFEALAELGDDPAVADTVALIEEYRLSKEVPVVDVWRQSVRATSVSSLIEDPEAFAQQIRRPIPTAPRTLSTLGTVFHSWVERELHMAGSDPASQQQDLGVVDEDADLSGKAGNLDEALLTKDEMVHLEKLRENFHALMRGELAGWKPVAVEEAFSMQVGGVSIQGRIDGVFERVGADEEQESSYLVVDWKSGRPITRETTPEKIMYFATQLRLYRRAWSERTGIKEDAIEARVIFVSGPSSWSLQELEALGAQGDLDQHVREAFGE